MADDASSRPPDLTPEPRSAAEAQPGSPTAGRRGHRGRARSSPRDLTRGSVPKNLWFLAWPQVAEGFLGAVDQIADLIWAGRLGFQAIAGLGVAQTYILMLMTARMGLDAGMRSMIARAAGARQMRYANHVLLQGLTLTTVFVVVVVAVGLFLTEALAANRGPQRRLGESGRGIHADPVHGHGGDVLPTAERRRASGLWGQRDASEGGDRDASHPPRPDPDSDIRRLVVPPDGPPRGRHREPRRSATRRGDKLPRAGQRHRPATSHPSGILLRHGPQSGVS